MKGFFDHPLYLLLALAVIPAGLYVYLRWRRLSSILIPLSGSPGRSLPEPARRLDPLTMMILVRTALFSAAWIFLAIAAASPRWGTELQAARQEGSSVILVMDISRSMTVADLPGDRLHFASRYASLLVENLENSRCGVVLSKGSSVLAVPLTSDHRAVRNLLDSLSPNLLSAPGTGLGKGIETALASFPSNSSASRTVIVFTDGDEPSLSLEEAARSVRASGASLILVGTGTAAGAGINIFPGSDEPVMQTTVLREDLLRSAARLAGRHSFYVNGTEAGSARRILEAVAPATASRSALVYSPRPVYRYCEFLLAALFCFMAGCVAGGRLWQTRT